MTKQAFARKVLRRAQKLTDEIAPARMVKLTDGQVDNLERIAANRKTGPTPGPWGTCSTFVCTGTGGEGYIVADCEQPIPASLGECEANARLIAAAPELAKAVRELLDAYAPGAQATVNSCGEGYLHSSVRNARAAMEKAGVA
jgi:hypothetical protein